MDATRDAINSGDVKAVAAGLEELKDLQVALSPEDTEELVGILSSSRLLLENTSQDVDELSVALVETIEFIKDYCDPEYLNETEKSEIIEIIEASSKTLEVNNSITTSSIVATSLVSDQEEIELDVPTAIPLSELPIKLDLENHIGEKVNMAVMNESYKDILPTPHGENSKISSPIVSINFMDLEKQTGDNISFSLIFQQKEHSEFAGSDIKRQCVYLNTSTNQWLTNGCITLINADGTCTCTCSHTTSFAVLLSPTGIVDQHGQEIVTYTMFAINLVFLTLTFCLIAPFRKLREKMMVMIQLCLIFTLVLGYISFLILSASTKIKVDIAGDPLLSLNAGCVAGVIISQYFFLSAFYWMGCAAWTFFNKIARAVKTYGKTDKYYFHKCAVISWTCPIIFPVAGFLFSLIPNSDDYNMPYVGAERENGTSCWVEDPWRLIGFLAPAYLILLFNCVCFGMVTKVIVASTKPGSGTDIELVKTAKAMMVAAMSVGLPWVVAGLAFGPGANVMQYLFIVFTGLQGPLLFIALVLFQDDVKANAARLIKMQFTTQETANIGGKQLGSASAAYSTSQSHINTESVVIERKE